MPYINIDKLTILHIVAWFLKKNSYIYYELKMCVPKYLMFE